MSTNVEFSGGASVGEPMDTSDCKQRADETVERVFLHNVIQLRAEKSSVSLNLEQSTAANVEVLTVLQNVPTAIIDDCCAALGYYIRLAYGARLDANCHGCENKLGYRLFHKIQQFDEYIQLCRKIVESVVENVKIIYSLQNDRNQAGDDEPSDANDDIPGGLRSMYEMLRHMDSVFQQFYTIFTDEENFPRRLIRDKLFVSSCLSKREPVNIRAEHLTDRAALFSALVSATLPMSEQSNTIFEAFFNGGFFIICLLNIMTNSFTSDASRGSNNFTRVRALTPEDVEAVTLLRDVNSPLYLAAIRSLPEGSFNTQTDVYLSSSDTLTTVFMQFVGRVFLRLYEWYERSDVRDHVASHFVPENARSLFSIVGRGPDQKSWIRFFKRNSERQPKIFVRLEPLLQMNDELMCNTGGSNCSPAAGCGGGVEKKVVVSSASADTIQRYHMLKDFLKRYDDFCRARFDRDFWTKSTERFSSVVNEPIADDSPLTSFDTWCTDVNAVLFPGNFTMLANDGHTSVDQLREIWAYRAQQYLMNRRFTTSKCMQLFEFMRTVEVKSRLIFDEQQFMFLFSTAMRSMPFLAQLFDDSEIEF